MKKLKASWAIALILTIASSGFASSSKPQVSKSRTATEQDILQVCREAVAELQFRRESEATLKKQVEELRALSSAKDERIQHLEAAITKYEAAVAARSQAETFVSELRSNYEKQVALAEKQLAIEQQKTNFWRVFAKLGIGMGIVVGGIIGFVLGNK